MNRVLLVDDEPGILFTLKEVFVDRGYEVETARSGKEALEKLEAIDAVVTDLSMPGMSGLELLQQIRERDESLPVVLLTAHGSERVAVNAIKAGAYDYLTKPFDIDEIFMVVERALETRKLRITARHLSAEQSLGRRIIGDSPPMRRLLETVRRIANRDITVLVTGETGTGKELIGSLLHAQSHRAKKPLVRFNCAAIPSELAEAELFGHAKGAFTGAMGTRRGFFAEANGGTLVLDEVGELPLNVQAKLLRAIHEGEIQPVGSGRVERVDVRIVACTNRNLREDAAQGTFRQDLYYRLAVVELHLPSLRQRKEEIPPLAQEFARSYGHKFGLDDVRLSPALLEQLQHSEWPGNVRQLENTIARLTALSTGGLLDVGVLSESGTLMTSPDTHLVEEDEAARGMLDGPSLREQVEAFERNIIARALLVCRGNQSEAARRLGTSRVTLIDKIKKYKLTEEPTS